MIYFRLQPLPLLLQLVLVFDQAAQAAENMGKKLFFLGRNLGEQFFEQVRTEGVKLQGAKDFCNIFIHSLQFRLEMIAFCKQLRVGLNRYNGIPVG